MPKSAPPISDPYCVQIGDTLSSIAKRCNRTVSDLKRYNSIPDANRLKPGQTLYLSEETAFGISVLFLDVLRHPIENLAYQLRFDGKVLKGITDEKGVVLNKVTENAFSQIEIWVRNVENQWQKISSTTSGYGHKLITAVSNFFVVKSETERLPDGAPPKPNFKQQTSVQAPPSVQARPPLSAEGVESKNNPAIKTKQKNGPQGQSIVEIAIDIPEGLMNLFQQYTAEKITEAKWKDAADRLDCEVEVLKAIAQVESKGAGFWKLNGHNHVGIVPAILFERHYFHRLTCANGPRMNTREHRYHGIGVAGCHSPYDCFPDICYPVAFVARIDKNGHKTLGNSNANMLSGTVEVADQYGDSAKSYLRLINAYRLNPEAALKSCSWGMFQIMGEEHQISCATPTLNEFMREMCSGERGQLEILRRFIGNKAGGKLLAAVQSKDWSKIAYFYNGPSYQTYGYDSKIQNAYQALKRNT